MKFSNFFERKVNKKEGVKKKNEFLKRAVLAFSLLGMSPAMAEKVGTLVTSETAGTVFTIEGANRCLLGTVWHVAKYVDGRARVKLDGRKYKVNVLWKNEEKDLAIIEILNRNGDRVVNCDKNPYILDQNVSLGEEVVAIGYPGNSQRKRKHKNIIDRERTKKEKERMGEYVMRGKQLRVGMSGGPVVAEDDGKVVGVNVGKYTSKKMKNYSIISGVEEMIDVLKARDFEGEKSKDFLAKDNNRKKDNGEGKTSTENN